MGNHICASCKRSGDDHKYCNYCDDWFCVYHADSHDCDKYKMRTIQKDENYTTPIVKNKSISQNRKDEKNYAIHEKKEFTWDIFTVSLMIFIVVVIVMILLKWFNQI